MSDNKQMKNLHVVLGATGSLGRTLVLALVESGKEVVAVVRNVEKANSYFQNKKIRIRQADLMDAEGLKKAISGAAVVYHCGGLPYGKWLKFFPVMNRNVINAVKREKAVLVYSDNLYMYGKMNGEKIDETHSVSKESKKGYLRHQLANNILEYHQIGDIKAVIARSGDFYGPFVVNGFTEPLFLNPIKGKPASWIGNISHPHSLIYVKNMATAMIYLADNPDTYGEIWHVPGDKALTGEEFIKKIALGLGKDIKIKVLKEGTMKLLGLFIPIVKELKELLFEWNYPFVIDGSKFQKRFPEYKPTGHKEALKETIHWFKTI